MTTQDATLNGFDLARQRIRELEEEVRRVKANSIVRNQEHCQIICDMANKHRDDSFALIDEFTARATQQEIKIDELTSTIIAKDLRIAELEAELSRRN